MESSVWNTSHELRCHVERSETSRTTAEWTGSGKQSEILRFAQNDIMRCLV
jgi:hypothetical protein